jgi:hypothetical protein
MNRGRNRVVCLPVTFLSLLVASKVVQAQQSNLPEKEITLNVNGLNAQTVKPYVNYPPDNSLSVQPVQPDGHTTGGSYIIASDRGYHLCREIKRDVALDGAAAMSRNVMLGPGMLIYQFSLMPDPVFKKTSTVNGTITILEVKDPLASKCVSLKDSFPSIVQWGPSIGWIEVTGYVEGNDRYHHSIYLTASASQSAFPKGVYCTHKYIINTADGNNGSMLVKWTMQDMSVQLDATSQSDPYSVVGNRGGHIGASLFVKFVPQRDSSCTEEPPADFAQRFRQATGVKSPDGSIRFVMPR